MPRLSRYAIRLEWNERHRVIFNDRLQIVARQVGFIGAHLTHGEVAGRGLYQRLKLRAIVRVGIGNFNAGDDVGFDSAHQVHLNPIMLFHQFWIGVFSLRPLNKAASNEAGRVNREITFDGLQRQATNLDQLFQERRECRVFKVTRDRSVVRGFRQESFAVRVPQVRSETATGECGVNLERAGKDDIGQGNARTPKGLDWFLDAFAEFCKQREKAFLFMRLRSVVGRPFLLIGLFDGDCFREGLSLAIVGVLALSDDLHGINMLASELPCREVRTGAMRVGRIGLDRVGVLTAFWSETEQTICSRHRFVEVSIWRRLPDRVVLVLVARPLCFSLSLLGDWLTMDSPKINASNRVWFSKRGSDGYRR